MYRFRRSEPVATDTRAGICSRRWWGYLLAHVGVVLVFRCRCLQPRRRTVSRSEGRRQQNVVRHRCLGRRMCYHPLRGTVLADVRAAVRCAGWATRLFRTFRGNRPIRRVRRARLISRPHLQYPPELRSRYGRRSRRVRVSRGATRCASGLRRAP